MKHFTEDERKEIQKWLSKLHISDERAREESNGERLLILRKIDKILYNSDYSWLDIADRFDGAVVNKKPVNEPKPRQRKTREQKPKSETSYRKVYVFEREIKAIEALRLVPRLTKWEKDFLDNVYQFALSSKLSEKQINLIWNLVSRYGVSI